VNPQVIVEGVTWFVVFLFSTTLHEAAHALVAWKLGDPTAYEGGQVSLNPIPHIRREPWGMVIVPILYFALTQNGVIGWASAPYDPAWAHRYPKRAALMAAAGPAANLLLALVGGVLIRLGVPERVPGIAAPILILFLLNLLLCVFNLLPLPPLDGSAILPAFMSDGLAERYRAIIHQPIFSMISFLVAWNIFPHIFAPIRAAAFRLLMAGG
jgi:Zn-dependent protease